MLNRTFKSAQHPDKVEPFHTDVENTSDLNPGDIKLLHKKHCCHIFGGIKCRKW